MSRMSAKERQEIFSKPKNIKAFIEIINRSNLPTRIMPAQSTVFRFIDPDPNVRLDYFDIFRQLPPMEGKGADSGFNRWSGRRADGKTRGVAGSSWGSTDGITAEGFFYSCLKGYDPSSGPRRILPSLAPLVVAGANAQFPYCEGAPHQLPFMGKMNTNIMIACTVRDIETVDMDVTSERFQEWNSRVSRLLKEQLTDLEFNDFAEAIGDVEFKEIPRLIGNSAYANGHEALGAKSAQKDRHRAPGYDPSQANTFTLFGQDNESLTDKLVGTGVFAIRTDTATGTTATINPVSVFAPKVERGLILSSSGGLSGSTSSSGPSSDIVASATSPAPSDGASSGASSD